MGGIPFIKSNPDAKMKLSKTFVPKKNLEAKTKELLEDPKILAKNSLDYCSDLYKEIKKEFPNFINYLMDLYPPLEIVKTKKLEGIKWQFYKKYPSLNRPVRVGLIKEYIKNSSRDMSEYGYEAGILIKGKWHKIKYRKGYLCFDSVWTVLLINDPLRIDKSKNIPFL